MPVSRLAFLFTVSIGIRKICNMSNIPIKRVAILGGGTSGWLTAAYLSKNAKKILGYDLNITLVESSDIGTIGVGEATIPTIRDTLQTLGISERDFIKKTNATFKQSIKFINWNTKSKQSHYHHNFSQPYESSKYNYAEYWVANKSKVNKPYNYACTIQSDICDYNLAPKRVTDADYTGPLNYAYHLDAGKFAELLKDMSIENGVNHIVGLVSSVEQNNDGSIASILINKKQKLCADLFIDCSGFNALLIEQTLKSKFTPLSDTLFVDSAVTASVPHLNENELPSATSSTAQDSGWIWDIGLQNRRGTGYVYSSKYCDKATAEQTLADYHGVNKDELDFRHLKMKTGTRDAHWIKNCVAIGLSAGFIEPLESTGIYFVESAVKKLLYLFPRSSDMESCSEQYNSYMKSEFDSAVDFIKLHYVLSDRIDTPFWKDNKLPSSIPTSLKQLLERINHRVINAYDMPVGVSCFNIFSYFSVILGMEHTPKSQEIEKQWPKGLIDLSKTVENILQQSLKHFPTHKELVDAYINSKP